MIRFVTLGPAGSNHQFVAERYLAFHDLGRRASISFFTTFAEGAAAVLEGRADYMIQCAVHPATVATVAQYKNGLYVVDTFISRSRDLAIVRNRAATAPKTLALMDPTRDYTDVSRWEKTISEVTVVAVADGLREGKYEAGLTYVSVAADEPERFIVDEFIGSVDDAWVVYGRTRVSGGDLVAWPDSPAARLFRQEAAGG